MREKMMEKNDIVLFGLALVLGLVGGFFISAIYYHPSQNISVNNSSVFLSESKINEITDLMENVIYIRTGHKPNMEFKSYSDEGQFYILNYSIDGNSLGVPISKDGEWIFYSVIRISDLKQQVNALLQQEKDLENKSVELNKSSKPSLVLFVMSYCPFGLQSEKALIPVYKLLKNYTNISIKFVSYAMHGKKELDENTRQYCIQKLEGTDKYIDYLECFVTSGDYVNCLKNASINQTAISSCVNLTDEKYNISKLYTNKSTWLNGMFPRFPIFADLNKIYGVAGSPTWVINGKTIDEQQYGYLRNPEALKEAICKAFLNPPAECNQTLETRDASPGIGPMFGSASGTGSCG